ncbi:unnamed protein product, partial [Closterium sp. NIES-54]
MSDISWGDIRSWFLICTHFVHSQTILVHFFSHRLQSTEQGYSQIAIPIPRADKLIDQLRTARVFFSKIELRGGYHQIRVEPSDCAKTTFRTRYRSFEYTVMPFGLTNAPANFQMTMNEAFRPLLDKCVIIYLDDILVYSRDKQQHLVDLEAVFTVLDKHGLVTKGSKYEFFQDMLDFLGHVISVKHIYSLLCVGYSGVAYKGPFVAPDPPGPSAPAAAPTTAGTTIAATAAPGCCATMASLRVLAFDHEGRPIQFDTWLDDLQLYLLSNSRDSVSLFDLASGAATAPPATAETQALYDAVVVRYSLLATTALGRLLLPYLFPELSAFATVKDLVSHLRASDARYRATVPAEFLDRNPPPMLITLYFIVTRLPDSLRSVRDHFLSLNPTSLTVDLLEEHLIAVATSAVAV